MPVLKRTPILSAVGGTPSRLLTAAPLVAAESGPWACSRCSTRLSRLGVSACALTRPSLTERAACH
eukprot:7598262-Alexandrium_andersonii.AAC.1